MRKIIVAMLSLCMCFGLLVGCSSGGRAELPHYDQSEGGGGGEYNTSLFYRNDANYYNLADPSVIYITEGEEAGWYYAYGTSNSEAGRGFSCARSKDMCHWETVGTAFMPDSGSSKNWANPAGYWAPEILYYKTEEEKAQGLPGKYYLYYSAQVREGAVNALGEVDLNGKTGFIKDSDYNQNIGVAVSDTPYGPFDQFNGVNADGETITDSTILFTHLSDKLWEMKSDNNIAGNACIREYDVHPYTDPVSGKLYLYFASEARNPGTPEIWGMEMKDPVTPDYDTLSYLVAYQKTSVDATEKDFADQDGSIVVEAPHMYYRDGIYYMTYSTFGFNDSSYRVNVAVGKSPLGTFVKPGVEQGNPILSADWQWNNISGTGHNCFVEVGDQLMMVYHEHVNRVGGGDRAMGMAPVMFLEDSATVKIDGQDVTFDMMHVNGPTWAVQPLPEKISGYKNLAPLASVKATNAVKGTEKYLTDGVVQIRNYAYLSGSKADPDDALNYDMEFRSSKETEITLTFDTPVELRAVMIYNSYDYYRAFTKIDSIEFTLEQSITDKDGKEFKGVAFINDLLVLERDICDEEIVMRPGGSATAEFNPIVVSKIKIKISAKYSDVGEDGEKNAGISVSDICLLGKTL